MAEGCGRKIGPYDCCSVVQGDCLEVMSGLPGGCVNLLITDPPYFLPAIHYQTRTTFARSLADLSILEHFFRSVLLEVDRVLADDGFLYLFCDGQSYPVFFVQAYPYFRSVRPLVWDKMTSINGYSWRHQHELILFGTRRESEAVRTGDGDILRRRAVPVEDRVHPAQKPDDLLGALIEKSSGLGELVCDPFAGSGRVLAVARQMGRHFFGCDTEGRYVEAARDTLAKAQPPLFVMEPEQTEMAL